MKLIKRETGKVIEFIEGMSWVKHYDKCAKKTIIMMGDDIMEEIDGELSMEQCDLFIASKWDISKSNETNH